MSRTAESDPFDALHRVPNSFNQRPLANDEQRNRHLEREPVPEINSRTNSTPTKLGRSSVFEWKRSDSFSLFFCPSPHLGTSMEPQLGISRKEFDGNVGLES